MQALNDYVAQKNSWGKIFGSKPLSLNNAQDRKAIAESIDADLSPENLCCDGELPRSQVQAKYKRLTTVAQQLIKLDPTVSKYMYEFG